MRRLVLLLSVLALACGLMACGGSSDSDDSSGGDGPALTVTVTDLGHNIMTNGFVVPVGEAVKVRYVNERSESADVELFAFEGDYNANDERPADVEADDSRTLEAGADEVVTVTFETEGQHRGVVDPVSAEPSGVVAGGGTFEVG